MTAGPTVRVFFALWPDADATSRLHALAQQWHASLGGRLMREETLHCTLEFIGDLAVQRVPDLLEAASGIQLPGFSLQFNQGGCWRHNHIAFLGMRQIPEALRDLHFELARRLQAADFPTEKRDFSPHITLLRKANCFDSMQQIIKENPATEPVVWTVRDFVLVKSSMSANGSRYEQIGRWPLL